MVNFPDSKPDGIFISYSQADNGFRWVNHLMETLRKLFKRISGGVEPRFHFDECSIRGNDPLDKTLERNVKNSAVFLVVMSKNWCASNYCPRELEWFIEAADDLDSARKRIFILQFSDHPVARWPKELRQNVAKPFFVEAERGVIKEISFNTERSGTPPSVCYRLAREIWGCLEVLGCVPPPKCRSVREPQILVPNLPTSSRDATPAFEPASTATEERGSVIFLSEVHRNLSELRRKIAEDLRREGYQVVPVDREFRNDRSAAESVIPALLRQATLVVQLHHEKPIGTEEFDDSFDRWLKEQTTACEKTPDDNWLRWRRQGLLPEAVADQQHRALLFENDVVADDEAQLTTIVLQRVRAIEARAKANVVSNSGRPILVRTKEATKLLADGLSDVIDSFESDSAESLFEALIVREEVALATVEAQLKQKSVTAAGYFVVYGDTDEDWAAASMKECRKLALARRVNPPITAVYVRPPDDQPRPQVTPGRFEIVRHDEHDKLQLVLKQASEVRS